MRDWFTAGSTHPDYALFLPTWLKLGHAYEGTGGFMDGTYIVPHPREWLDYRGQNGQPNDNPRKPTAKLLERRKLARYENVAFSVIDQKQSALFRQPPTRTESEQASGYLEWVENVDGAGTHLNDWMRRAWTPAAVYGHIAIVFDWARTDRPLVTQADRPTPYLARYDAPCLLDWATNERGKLLAVKLVSGEAREHLDSPVRHDLRRVRILDAERWLIRDEPTQAQKAKRGVQARGYMTAPHGLGRLPVVLLQGRPRTLIEVVGQSVLCDPQLFIDLYNLTSEARELLRKQTFGTLNVPLGVGDQAMTLDQARSLLGEATGTHSVLFSGLPAQYISPDPENVKAYADERRDLLRTIFRLCSVPWEADSRDAEAEGSLRLKREAMNQVIADYAALVEKAEYAIAELWFRWRFGVDQWEKAWKASGLTINYPRTFDVDSFEGLLEQATASDGLGLRESKTFSTELAMRQVSRFLPDAPEALTRKIRAELESRQTAEERRQQQLRNLSVAFGGAPDPGEEPEPPASAAAVN